MGLGLKSKRKRRVKREACNVSAKQFKRFSLRSRGPALTSATSSFPQNRAMKSHVNQALEIARISCSPGSNLYREDMNPSEDNAITVRIIGLVRRDLSGLVRENQRSAYRTVFLANW